MSTSHRSRKAQTALEFLAMVIFMTMMFAGVYSVMGERQTASIERQVNLQAVSVADRIGYELDLALAQGEGYSRSFTLRDTIGGSDYNVTVENGTVAVEWADSIVFSSTALDSPDGTISPGTNRIRNTGGSVEVVE